MTTNNRQTTLLYVFSDTYNFKLQIHGLHIQLITDDKYNDFMIDGDQYQVKGSNMWSWFDRIVPDSCVKFIENVYWWEDNQEFLLFIKFILSNTERIRTVKDNNKNNYVKLIQISFLNNLLSMPSCDYTVKIENKNFCKIDKINLLLDYLVNNNFLIDDKHSNHDHWDIISPLFEFSWTIMNKDWLILKRSIEDKTEYGTLLKCCFKNVSKILQNTFAHFNNGKVLTNGELRRRIERYPNSPLRPWGRKYQNEAKFVLLCLDFNQK